MESIHEKVAQRRLTEFFKAPSSEDAPKMVPHREIIIYILQLGIALTEKSLLRAVGKEIFIQRSKGREVAPISLQTLRQQLQQLAREKIVEQIGYCWRLRY